MPTTGTEPCVMGDCELGVPATGETGECVCVGISVCDR